MAETLTYGVLKKRLQIANCCAGKKGSALIDKMYKGIDCTQDVKDIKLIINLVDAIRPYACVIQSEAAVCEYSTTSWTGGVPAFNLVCAFTGFTVGGFSNRTVLGQTSIATAMANLVTAINTAAGETIAFYIGTTFTMYAPTTGSAGNSYHVTFSASGLGAPNIVSPFGTFSGGVDGNENTEFDDTDKCLTIEQVQSILDKLCLLCPGPATSYVRFRNS